MTNKFKKGQRAMVFEDPFTRKKQEGLATLVRPTKTEPHGHCEHWYVKFYGSDGGTYQRWVNDLDIIPIVKTIRMKPPATRRGSHDITFKVWVTIERYNNATESGDEMDAPGASMKVFDKYEDAWEFAGKVNNFERMEHERNVALDACKAMRKFLPTLELSGRAASQNAMAMSRIVERAINLCDPTYKTGTTTLAMAIERGSNTGLDDARRHDLDPLNFAPTDNPYGMDSEPELYEAWQTAYEDLFESMKGKR